MYCCINMHHLLTPGLHPIRKRVAVEISGLFERMKNEKSLFWTALKTGPEKCFFVARWKGAQENNSVGKELKYHFQLYCLMAVGIKISPDDITLHCVFQTWKLEAVLSLLRRLLGSCFFSGSSCTLLSLISLLLPISAHCFRDLFFWKSAIYDN